MQNRRLFLAVILSVSLLFVSACQTAGKPVQEPGRADVATKAWETPAEVEATRSPAVEEEMVAIREQNREMRKTLAELRKHVKALDDQPAPGELQPAPAAPVAEKPIPASTSSRPSGETIVAVIRRAGIPDLEFDVNRAGDAFVRLSGCLAFRSGRAELRGEAKNRLSRLSDVLKSEFPDLNLRVEGHTDSDPIRKSNWQSNEALSMARARAVEKHFTETLGWSASRITSQGYGAERPIATNSTREGKAQNRRIEIVLTD